MCASEKSSKCHNPRRHCAVGRSNRYVASDLWMDATASIEPHGLNEKPFIDDRSGANKSRTKATSPANESWTWVVRSLDRGCDSQRCSPHNSRVGRGIGLDHAKTFNAVDKSGSKSLLEARMHPCERPFNNSWLLVKAHSQLLNCSPTFWRDWNFSLFCL